MYKSGVDLHIYTSSNMQFSFQCFIITDFHNEDQLIDTSVEGGKKVFLNPPAMAMGAITAFPSLHDTTIAQTVFCANFFFLSALIEGTLKNRLLLLLPSPTPLLFHTGSPPARPLVILIVTTTWPLGGNSLRIYHCASRME